MTKNTNQQIKNIAVYLIFRFLSFIVTRIAIENIW